MTPRQTTPLIYRYDYCVEVCLGSLFMSSKRFCKLSNGSKSTSKMKFFIAFCAILLGAVNAGIYQEHEWKMNVTGKAGARIEFGYTKTFASSDTVKIQLKSVKEKDTNNNDITTNGHTYTTFHDFEYNGLTMRKFPGSQVDVTMLSLTAKMDNQANIEIKITFVRQDGEITDIYNTSTPVTNGMLKFGFAISNWTFASNGKFIDVGMSVKGKKDKPTKKGNTNDYELGAGAIMKLVNKVVIDGATVDMPSGYPAQNDGDVFTFRLPKPFNSLAEHESTITLGPLVTPNMPTGASSHAPWLTMVVLVAALVKLAVF